MASQYGGGGMGGPPMYAPHTGAAVLASGMGSPAPGPSPFQVALRGLTDKAFGAPYGTKTFQRPAFKPADREKAWLDQARIEAGIYVTALQDAVDNAGSFDEYLAASAALQEATGRQQKLEQGDLSDAKAAIDDMGTTATGIHLRHVIPCSDIAAFMHMATSDSTFKLDAIQPGFTAELRKRVGVLMQRISPDAAGAWKDLAFNGDGTAKRRLLMSDGGRKTIRALYVEMATSSRNLFQGDGTINMAIQNRPDFSTSEGGVHPRQHLEGLRESWLGLTKLLDVDPGPSKGKVFNVDTGGGDSKELAVTGLWEHRYSRPLKAVFNQKDSSALDFHAMSEPMVHAGAAPAADPHAVAAVEEDEHEDEPDGATVDMADASGSRSPRGRTLSHEPRGARVSSDSAMHLSHMGHPAVDGHGHSVGPHHGASSAARQ